MPKLRGANRQRTCRRQALYSLRHSCSHFTGSRDPVCVYACGLQVRIRSAFRRPRFATTERAMKEIGMAYAIGLGLLLICGIPLGTGASAAVKCQTPACPPHPKGTGGYELQECDLIGPVNPRTACKVHGNACSPMLECHYKSVPGAQRPCGTFYNYIPCVRG